VEEDAGLFLKLTTIQMIVFLALNEQDEQIAVKIWLIMVKLARWRFLEIEQFQTLFIAVVCEQQLLRQILFFVQEHTAKFHKTIKALGSYELFMPLPQSHDDFVVKTGLQCLDETFSLQFGNAIRTKLMLRDALIVSIKIINRSYLKPRAWMMEVQTYLTGREIRPHLFPFICFFSAFCEGAEISESVDGLNSDLSILQCPGWYFGLFFLHIQMNHPTVNLTMESEVIRV
jgi:hypothetical protein